MSDLKLNSDDIRKLQKSIDLTQDRAESEGFVGSDDALEALKELTYVLLGGGNLDSLLNALDMVIPDN